MDSLPGYDHWKTTPPEPDWGVCPECGASQEDAELHGDTYICPCGRAYDDDEAHPDYSQDEPSDLDERRGLGDEREGVGLEDLDVARLVGGVLAVVHGCPPVDLSRRL